MKRTIVVFLTCLAISAFGLVSTESTASAATQIKGEVQCINSSVTGVWIAADSSKAGFAKWKVPVRLGGVSKAEFSYSLNKGGKYRVHVGCGGTSKKWGITAKSGSTSGSGKKFRCNDISPALQAAGIAVLKRNLAKGIAYKTCKLV